MIYHQIIKDSTDKSVTIRIIDNNDAKGTPEEAVEHDTSGIALWYRRDGAAKTTITPASLAALTTSHTDGGIEHIDDGYYRLDVPDAAFATGVDKVVIGGTVTGMVVIGASVELVDDVPLDGSNRVLASVDATTSNGNTALTGSGLATAANLATASGHAESAATAATSADGKLPNLTANNLVPVDVKRINAVELTGDGDGTPMGAA